MGKRPPPFPLAFGNIPIINIRLEYNRYLGYFESGRFESDLAREPGVLRSPYMIWLTRAEAFLATVMMRTTSGLEAYLRFAVTEQLHLKGRYTPAARDLLARASGVEGGERPTTCSMSFRH